MVIEIRQEQVIIFDGVLSQYLKLVKNSKNIWMTHTSDECSWYAAVLYFESSEESRNRKKKKEQKQSVWLKCGHMKDYAIFQS